MFVKRWIGLALVALLLIGIISAVSGAGQRDAWMQGYLAGRLSASEDGGTALTPYLMANGGFGPHSSGFGRGLGLFLGLGFLVFGLCLVSRRLHGRQRGGPNEWHEHMQEARRQAQQWHERHHQRWQERSQGPGGDSEQRMF